MLLLTTLGISTLFFGVFITIIHLSVIGFNYLKTKSKTQKENDVKKMRAILEEIRKEDETKTLNALNTIDKH